MTDEQKQKFDEIFTDKCIEDAFFEWHSEKIKERDKRTWFEKNLAIFFGLAVFVMVVGVWFYFFRGRVVQEVHTFRDGDTKFCTWVWVDGKIAAHWITELPLATDSLKRAQKNEGERILQLNK